MTGLDNLRSAATPALFLALLFSSTAAGCASYAQQTESLNLGTSVTFRPPSGWLQKQSTFVHNTPQHIFGGMWSSGTRDSQIISYGYGSLPDNLRPIVRSSPNDVQAIGAAIDRLAQSMPIKIGTVLSSHAIKVCDRKMSGWYRKTKSTLLGLSMTNESVYIVRPRMFATATYSRPQGSLADDAAERSLTSLCVKS